MKKIIAVLSVIAVILCFSSCKKGGGDNLSGKDEKKDSVHSGIFSDKKDKEKETTTTTTMPEEKVSHIADKIEKGRFDSFDGYSDEEKQKIKEQVEKDGYTLEYNSDGSGTLSNEEGSWFVGKGWVDNEYTKGMPAVDFGTVTMSSEMDEGGEKYYIFLIRDTTAYKVQEYVEALKKAGFSETGKSESNPDAGVVTFIGENGNGQHVEAAYSANGFTLKIVLEKQ